MEAAYKYGQSFERFDVDLAVSPRYLPNICLMPNMWLTPNPWTLRMDRVLAALTSTWLYLPKPGTLTLSPQP